MARHISWVMTAALWLLVAGTAEAEPPYSVAPARYRPAVRFAVTYPGLAGRIELVTCRKVKVRKHKRTVTKTKCTAKLVSHATFTLSGHVVRATLSRAGSTIASGDVVIGHASDVGFMKVTGRLRAGPYLLELWRGRNPTARQSVQLR